MGGALAYLVLLAVAEPSGRSGSPTGPAPSRWCGTATRSAQPRPGHRWRDSRGGGPRFVWAIIRGFIGLPEALVRGSSERRRSKGLSPSRGDDRRGARAIPWRRSASRATRSGCSAPSPLTLLLKGPGRADLRDREGAERAFQAMADDPETRVLGLRACSWRRCRRDDEIAARAYATEAVAPRAERHLGQRRDAGGALRRHRLDPAPWKRWSAALPSASSTSRRPSASGPSS